MKERTGDYTRAAKLLDSQFALVSSQPDRVVAMFHSVLQSGQDDRKIAEIVDILKLHGSDKPWSDAIGRCTQLAAMAGKPHTAGALFAMIPSDSPARSAAGLHLPKLLYDQARVSEAKQLLLQLEEQGAVNADLEALLGNCFESERQTGPALQAYQRAIRAIPRGSIITKT